MTYEEEKYITIDTEDGLIKYNRKDYEEVKKILATIFDYARICKSLSCCECPLCINDCNGK